MTLLTAPAAVALVLLGAAGAVLGALVDRQRPDGRPAERALEAGGLALAGGLAARAFVLVVIEVAADPGAGGLLAGWAFSFVAGVLDLVPLLLGEQVFTTPAVMLWIALVTGALTGMANGAGRIHPRGRGVWQFLADTTWGLTGSSIGLLLHAVNLTRRGRRADDGRTGAHRYHPGFHPPGRASFAITMGQVMSNVRPAPGEPLYQHERLHVQQSRQYGPFYLLTYLLWSALLGAAGMAAGIRTRSVFRTAEAWSYYNNPWEAWAYSVQRACHPEGRDPRRSHCPTAWQERTVKRAAVAYFAGVGLITLGVLLLVYG